MANLHSRVQKRRENARERVGEAQSSILPLFSFLYSVASDFCEVNIPEKIQIKTIYPYGEGMVVFILGSPIFFLFGSALHRNPVE